MFVLTFHSIWGVAGGARRVTVNTEIYIYAVLDLLFKVVLGLWLLLVHRSTPEINVDLGGYWAYGQTSDGRIRIGDEDGA